MERRLGISSVLSMLPSRQPMQRQYNDSQLISISQAAHCPFCAMSARVQAIFFINDITDIDKLLR